MKGILIFIVVFGLLVFVHEFGHFTVAKWSGVLVREFSIGMGPKLFQVRKSQTTYTIRWLPLGGYVRLAGKDDQSELSPGMMVILELSDNGIVTRIDASGSDLPIEGIPVQVSKADLVDDLIIEGYENGDESKKVTYSVDHDATIIDESGTELQIAPRDTQFQEANVWKKLATNFAGPFMNIVLGFVVFMIWSLSVVGPATTTVAKVTENSPAQVAKIKSNDEIIAVNHQHVDNFEEISNAIGSSKGKTLIFTVRRSGKSHQVKVTPEYSKKTKSYLIGIQAKTDDSIGSKVKRGWTSAVETTGMIFNAVGGLFRHFSLNKLSGPVGIYSETSQVSQLGFTYILEFLAMISINLGIVNLIPIPGLDGGKVLLNLIEIVRGKPISEDHEAIVDLAGVILLLVLIVAVTGNDIYRYFIK